MAWLVVLLFLFTGNPGLAFVLVNYVGRFCFSCCALGASY